jgi:putative Mn2+ efflux pump MntP
VLQLLALVLPLGLDSFAVAAALGIAGLSARQRIRLSVIMASFEGGMPLVGLLFGALLSKPLGEIGEYVALLALAAVGASMVRSGDGDENGRFASLARARGPAIVLIGLTVSVDELAIGFVLGLLDVPVVPAVLAIVAQALLATQLGFALGAKLGERFLDHAERLSGYALIAVAVLLLAAHFIAP